MSEKRTGAQIMCEALILSLIHIYNEGQVGQEILLKEDWPKYRKIAQYWDWRFHKGSRGWLTDQGFALSLIHI